jgi:Membrane-bound metallopeptidase
MKYLPQLSKEELQFICSLIPHQNAISYFSRYPKEFAKVRRGFRPNKLTKRHVESILLNFHNHNFISNLIEQHIHDWVSITQEQINMCIQEGNSKEVAIIKALSQSNFSNNIQLYFKLVNENYSEEYIGFLSAFINIYKETSVIKEVKENIEKELRLLESDLRTLKVNLDSSRGKQRDSVEEQLKKSSAEINEIKKKIVAVEDYADTIDDNQKRIEFLLNENAMLQKKIEIMSGELSEIKDACILTEKNESIRIEIDQEQIIENISELPIPKSPSDIDEFKEYLSYNLENIGLTKNTEYFRLLIEHLSEVLFQGFPIIISHKVGLNLIKCTANTLIGNQNAKMLVYYQNITSTHINHFFSTADRIVGLANFLGNFNETELIPIFEKHRDKIIFLTVAYNRTLNYVSKEFLEYCRYLNLDRISALSLTVNLTEDPSSLEEQSKMFELNYEWNRYQRILKQILMELDFRQSLVERYCSYVKNEDDLCRLLAFEILPYCTDVLQINPYNISNQLNKYAGHAGRCPIKNLLLGWFAQ